MATFDQVVCIQCHQYVPASLAYQYEDSLFIHRVGEDGVWVEDSAGGAEAICRPCTNALVASDRYIYTGVMVDNCYELDAARGPLTPVHVVTTPWASEDDVDCDDPEQWVGSCAIVWLLPFSYEVEQCRQILDGYGADELAEKFPQVAALFDIATLDVQEVNLIGDELRVWDGGKSERHLTVHDDGTATMYIDHNRYSDNSARVYAGTRPLLEAIRVLIAGE